MPTKSGVFTSEIGKGRDRSFENIHRKRARDQEQTGYTESLSAN